MRFGFALALVACGGGSDGTGQAGSSAAGTNGAAGTSAAAGTNGAGGTSAAGTSGAAGRGGTTGSGGATGGSTGGATAGTSGGAGTTGGGGRGGATGNAGRGGTTGNGGRGGGGGGTGGAASGTMTLTSTAFTEGMTIPAAQTCTGSSHMSPPLTWTAGPTGTMAYAITLTDLTNNYVHWVLWDIPASTTSLPGNLAKTTTLTDPAGAKQVALQGNGYFGPCPSGTLHTYQFQVHAIDVATLPGASTTSAMRNMTRDAVLSHRVAPTAFGSLSGTSNASQ